MQTFISGNLTKDVDIKFFESGKIKATFSIACNVYDASKKEKVANFYNCEAWDKDAEFIADKFKKGEHITIVADFKQDEHEGKTYNKFVCKNIVFSGAYSVVAGIVEKEETRHTSNNVAIQFIKLVDNPVTIKNFNTKISVTQGNYYTVFGELSMTEDKKLILTAKNIIMDMSGRDTVQEIVKFADKEMGIDEELDEMIPF